MQTCKPLLSGKPRKQKGVVLFISLILLLILTLLGITAMQTTTMEEKMSGNMRDRSLAFHAAEDALRDAELEIKDMVGTSDFGSSEYPHLLGTVSAATISTIVATAATWKTTASKEATSYSQEVNSPPRYLILHKAFVAGYEGPMNMSGYGKNKAGSDIDYFVIYSRGTGGTDNAQVILQSYFGMRF